MDDGQVCRAVAGFAAAIERTRRPAGAGRLQLRLLQLMPLYGDLGRLDRWEAAVRAVPADGSVRLLVDAVLAVAVRQFGPFAVHDPADELDALARLLRRSGIPVGAPQAAGA